jgi:hypothetical protein
MGREDTVSVEELVLVQMFESEALVSVLERRGLITKAEVLDEVRRLKEQAAKAR